MSAIKCGWLSPYGEFTECNPYEHMSVAEKLTEGKCLYYMSDRYLLKHGWAKIYRESFCGHKWFIAWRGFLSEWQKNFLRPIFEDSNNDIDFGCKAAWEIENDHS